MMISVETMIQKGELLLLGRIGVKDKDDTKEKKTKGSIFTVYAHCRLLWNQFGLLQLCGV